MKASEARQLARETNATVALPQIQKVIKSQAEKGKLEYRMPYNHLEDEVADLLREDGYIVSQYPETNLTIISWE